MRYVSTRGQAAPIAFDAAMLSALAPDGGLYMPEAWPQLAPDEVRALATRTYPEVALQVLKRFAGEAIPLADLYAAIDSMTDKLDRQVQKYKQKQSEHNHESLKHQVPEA